MGHRRHVSPEQELQFNLHHVAEYNTAANFLDQPLFGPDGGLYLPSSHEDQLYSAPILKYENSQVLDPYAGYSHEDGPFQGSSGLGIRFGENETPVEANTAGKASKSGRVKHGKQRALDDSPSTLRSTTSDSSRRTRSGRVIRSRPSQTLKSRAAETGVNISSTTRKKNRRQKANNGKAPRIDKPLSELTKGLTEVPIRDMAAWVNRSNEVRNKEVEKKNGRIARPMNSFMLYRSAYAERTKVWCLQNNHQIVSAVSGASWPLEPPEVREKYNDLANTERENHARAHPNYKFSPSKGGQAKRKKEAFSDDEESDGNEVGDDDSDWKPRAERQRYIKPPSESEETLPLRDMALPGYNDPHIGASYDNQEPSWEYQMSEYPGQFEPYGGYHINSAYPFLSSYNADNFGALTTTTTQVTGMPDGIPGSYEPDLLQFQTRRPSPESNVSSIDPVLAQFHPPPASFGGDTMFFGGAYDEPPLPSQFDEWMRGDERI